IYGNRTDGRKHTKNAKLITTGTYDCNSKNTNYLLECGIWKIQYAVEISTSMKTRFSNHRSEHKANVHRIENANEIRNTLARHFKLSKHDLVNFRFYFLKHFKIHEERK